jgi:3,4-dihydroxy 2-butanone 4-phosphate synthase/GTP cyclohydrolase II
MLVRESVRVPLPTPFGPFEVRAFEHGDHIYLAMIRGDIGDGRDVLVRLHSECLTGDALSSLRCDCGVQLRLAMNVIASEDRGVLLYVTGHEGRGIGLVNKLRAYVAQDGGADTVDANLALGLPIDSRDYGHAAAVLAHVGVRTVRLLTNNPGKVAGLRAAGAEVSDVVPLRTAPHQRNLDYLRTKMRRLGHTSTMVGTTSGPRRPRTETAPDAPSAPTFDAALTEPTVDATRLLGDIRPRADRPYVALKYAQSLDGRIATSTGDSKWISGESERRISHAVRAACDGILVGIGTALRDRPQLTVRMVPGASPRRIVLDSRLRLPDSSPLLSGEAATTIITTARSDGARRTALATRGARIEVVEEDRDRVDLAAALARLRRGGIESLVVEGGATVITSFLSEGLADRMIVAVAPIVLGRGTDAVKELGITEVTQGIRLGGRTTVAADDDLVLAWDVAARCR